MALSEKWVLEKARELLWNPDYTGFNPIAFTCAIEAEVRRQDTELIRQMLEALSLPCDRWNATQSRIVREAIAAADAWLEGKSHDN